MKTFYEFILVYIVLIILFFVLSIMTNSPMTEIHNIKAILFAMVIVIGAFIDDARKKFNI